MKIRIIILVFVTFVITSCGTSNNFKSLSEFNIQESRLNDSTIVQVIFCNYGSIGNFESESENGTVRLTSDYFAHMIAHNRKGDTFNIISRVVPFNMPSPQGEEYYFISDSEKFQKEYDMMVTALSENTDKTFLKFDDIQKVIYMPELDEIVENSYPSYIGILQLKTN